MRNVFEYNLLLSQDKRTPELEIVKQVNTEEDSFLLPDKIVNLIFESYNMSNLAEEYIYILGLDNKCHINGIFLIAKGTVNASIFSEREIFIRLLMVGAVNFIVLHNHPVGDPSPSKEDIKFTQRLCNAGDMVAIPLVDHIIISEHESYFSFAEKSPSIIE